MPTLAEVREEARRARAAAQSQGQAPIPSEDVQGLEAAREVVDTFHPKPDSMGEAVAQTLRATTSTLADPMRAGLSTLTGENSFRDNLALERAKTARAVESVQNVSPNAPLTAARDATNMAALTAVTPGAAVATIPRALGFGAGMEMGREAFDTYEETGSLPSMEEELGAGATGAAGAALGVIAGGGLNFVVNKALGSGKKLPDQLTRYFSKTQKAVDLADQKMRKADVVINGAAVQRMLGRIERQLAGQGVSETATPKVWEAINVLRHRVGQGGDVRLTELNNIRRQIRDFDIRGESYGGIKTATDLMNKTINGLALSKGPGTVVSGDAKLGVAAWNSLNRNHIQSEKANVLTQLFRKAEDSSRQNGWTITRAMQKQASNFLNMNDRSRGKTLRMFSPDEQEMLKMISNGTAVGNALNALDAKVGHGAFSIIYNLAGALPAKIANNAVMRNKGQMVVDNIIHNVPVKTGHLSPLVSTPMLGSFMGGGLEGLPQGPAAGAATPLNLGALINPQGAEGPANPMMPPALGEQKRN